MGLQRVPLPVPKPMLAPLLFLTRGSLCLMYLLEGTKSPKPEFRVWLLGQPHHGKAYVTPRTASFLAAAGMKYSLVETLSGAGVCSSFWGFAAQPCSSSSAEVLRIRGSDAESEASPL
ncbi:hypothetical protein F5X96DRAFT_619468, partial [Biscogniauxia mediterranea]